MNCIRHTKCQLLFIPESKRTKRCSICTQYRENYLRRSLYRIRLSDKENRDSCSPSSPSSHVNYRFLSNEQKDERLHKLHQQVRLKSKALNNLKEKISRICSREGVQLDPSMSEDFLTDAEIFRNRDVNVFQRLFQGPILAAAVESSFFEEMYSSEKPVAGSAKSL